MPGIRSSCPISHVLDIFGDKWSLLIVRDIALYDKRSFGTMGADEGIAPSTLTDRLERLLRAGILTKERASGGPGKQYLYGLTPLGADLIPLLLEMMRWSLVNDPDAKASKAYLRRFAADRAKTIRDLQRPWLRSY